MLANNFTSYLCVCEGSIFEYHYIVDVTMKTVSWAYLNLRKGWTAPEMKEWFSFFNWECVFLSFANAGGSGHRSCQKPFYPSFWALPTLDGLKKVCKRSRLFKTEVERMFFCNVLLAFWALTFCHCLWTSFSLLVCLSTVWVTQWFHLSTLFLFTFKVCIPYVIFPKQVDFC